jgi:putative ribosome biogenesis GTPase RsgA
MNRYYEIRPVSTSKDEIRHPKLSEEGVIPKLCCSTILVGKSGSGKSVLLHNLMTRKEFFAGHFDKVFLISPTVRLNFLY